MLKLLNWPELHWWLCTKYHTSTYRSSIQYTQTIDYRYSIVARYKGVSSKFKFLLVFWGFEVRCCKLALWNDCFIHFWYGQLYFKVYWEFFYNNFWVFSFQIFQSSGNTVNRSNRLLSVKCVTTKSTTSNFEISTEGE